MHSRGSRIPPALKHGAYTATSVLPGESRSAFEKLHKNLVADLSPSGVLEDDIVMTTARLMWRKTNLGTLYHGERARARRNLIVNPKLYLKERLNSHYNREVFDLIKAEEDGRAKQEQVERELGDAAELIGVGEAATFDGLERELDVIERLDSAIARCLKRLLVVRGIKSISEVPSSVSPKSLPGPSKDV